MSYIETLTAKRLLLVDGIGALISALFIGLVWLPNAEITGLPAALLWWLAALPIAFCVLDFSNGLRGKYRFGLRLIAPLNLAYCAFSGLALSYYWWDISIWVKLYFSGEIGLVLILSYVELRFLVAKKA